MRKKIKNILLELVPSSGIENHKMDKVIDRVIELYESEAKNISSNLCVSGSDFKNEIEKLKVASENFEKACKEFNKV